MVFSDTSNLTGIIQRLEASTNLGDAAISGDTTLLKQFTAVINDYYMRATDLIISADGTWKWDDSNHTDKAIATTDLVASQSDYSIYNKLPGTTQDWLQVERVEIKDSNGSWLRLGHFDLRKEGGAIGALYENAGSPSHYDFDGASIELRPAPNYASTDGLKLYFNRVPLMFVYGDTTKKPGFPSIYHQYLVLGATYWWESKNTPEKSEQTNRDLLKMEKSIGGFLNQRNQDDPFRVERVYKSYK